MKKTHVGPDRCVWHRSCPFSSRLPSLLCIYIYINYKTLVIIKKKEEKLKKNSLRARKTPEASFRFFFVTVALPVVYFIIRIYKTLFSVIKYEENE